MRTRIPIAVRSLCLLLTISLLSSASGADYRPAVGQPHPDFVLPRIDNREPVSLSQFRGKKVLLIQFASW